MLKTAVRTVATIYIVYIAVTIFILLPAANFLAPWFVKEQYGRQLSTDIILFNPFSLNAQVRGASLLELDGSPFASIDNANVNLSLQSLLGNGLVLDEVSLQGLKIHVRHQGEGEFNFSDMLPTEEDPSEPAEETEIPGITVHRLAFSADRIQLTDEAREEAFTTHYDGLDIVVTDLSTVQQEGKPYRINAVAESGGALQWEGTVSLPEAKSAGNLTVSDLSLRTFWRFARPWLNFELTSGKLSLSGDYSISWAEDFSYQVNDGAVAVSSIDLRPIDPDQLADTALSLHSLVVGGIEIDGDRQHIGVAQILANQASITGWSEGEQVSLAELFAVDMPPSSADADAEAQEGPESLWTAEISDLSLEDSTVLWRSEYTDPPQLSITPLSARAQSIKWPLAGDSPLQLAFKLNGETEFNVSGIMALDRGVGEIEYHLSGLKLPMFNPNLPSALKANLSGGQLNVDGGATLNEFLPVEVRMDGDLSDFSATVASSEEALTRWDTVRWKQLRVNLDERTADMEKLMIHGYEGRLHIAKDGSINASNVWQEEVGERAGAIVEDLDLDKPWQVHLPEIFISDSAIDFKDESLPIPFRAVVGDVNGEILNLSSNPGASAKVDIKGSVDGYAPVVLVGSAAPFSELPALDLNLSFTGVDLVMLTPYSGTYAGYAIERGLLNLDLGYSLQDNHLEGKNNIVIEQLKLGDKVASDKALDLPLGLAIALLTDLNGVIDLKVPVEGDVDNPEFAIGGVIASAVVNLITKAVTAPFTLLASLVGAEDDLQRIAFPAGSAELNEPAIAKLDQLYQALAQRPGLTLIVSGRLNMESDRGRLQRAQLEEQLLEQGIASEDISKRGPDYMAAVIERYQSLTGDSSGQVSFSEQLGAVRGSMQVSEQQLLDLVQARAVVIKEHMVNELGLSADRAVINQAALLEGENTYGGVELELDT
ncbi:MAG: DUF748 domain-containing protein [Halioglobus sp.]